MFRGVTPGWGVLRSVGHTVAGGIAGIVLPDLGATAADISNRMIVFSLCPDIRTRLATVDMVGRFT